MVTIDLGQKLILDHRITFYAIGVEAPIGYCYGTVRKGTHAGHNSGGGSLDALFSLTSEALIERGLFIVEHHDRYDLYERR